MADSFSGRKIIQDAKMMAEIFQQTGGAAHFTTAELQRMGAVGGEAIAKLHATGKQIPPQLQAMADAAKSGESAFGGWGKQVLATAAGFVSAQAIIGAVSGVVRALSSELKTLTLQGSDVASVGDNFQRLAANAGHLGDVLLGTLRAGTRGTITDFELMKTVNQDLAAGMNLTDQQFGTLAKGAHALAQATGVDVKTAFDTMNDAMVTGRVKAVALLTGKIDLEAAEKKFAASLGTTAAHLSEEGKLEAARAGLLASVGAATERLGEQTDGLKDRVAQASVTWANFENDLGRSIATSSTLETGMVELQKALTQAFGGNQETLIRAIVEQIDRAAVALVGLAQAGVQTSGFLIKEFYAVQKVFGNLAQIIDGNVLAFKLFSKVAAAATFDTKGLERIDAELAMIETRMADRGKSLKAADAAQAGVDASTGRYVKTLAELQAKMEEARTTSAAFVGPLRDVAAGHDAAGAAAGRHGSLTKQSNEEISKAEAALEALRKALLEQAGALVPLTSAQRTVVEAQLKLGLSAEQIATILNSKLSPGFKITASAVSLFDDELKAAAEILKDMPARLDAFRKAGVDAATAVGKAFAGQPLVLREMAQTMGDLVLPSKQFAATGQLIGTVYADTGQVIARAMATGEAGLLKLTAAQKAQVSQLRELGVAAEDIAEQMGISFEQAGGQAQTFGDSLDMLASSLAQLAQVSGDSFGGIVQDISKAVVALKAFANALKTAYAAMGTAGIAMVGLTGAISSQIAMFKRMNDVVTESMSFVELRIHLESIQKEAEAAGISLDKAFAADNVEDLKAALEAIDEELAGFLDAVHGMGIVSQEELQAVADKSKAVYEYMLAKGTYTAEQLALAMEKSAHDQKVALGDAATIAQDDAEASGYKTREQLEDTAKKAEEQYKYMLNSGKYTAGEIAKAFEASNRAQAEAYGETTKAVDALGARYKTLSDQVAKEAPERHMGSIERAARKEMKALETQMASQNKQIEADAKAAAEAAADALKWELHNLDLPDVHFNVIGHLKMPPVPPGPVPPVPPGPVPGPQPGPQNVSMPSTSGNSGGGGGGTAVLELDGKMLAKVLVPYIPGAIKKYGL